MSTTDEYSDSSFDNYISKVVDTGIIDYIEQKSILQSKLRELEAKIHTSQQVRVAHDDQDSRVPPDVTDDKKEASQGLPEGPDEKKMAESIKQIEHTLLRIEASILQLQITVKAIQIKQKEKKAVSDSNNNNNNNNNNNKGRVSDTHL